MKLKSILLLAILPFTSLASDPTDVDDFIRKSITKRMASVDVKVYDIEILEVFEISEKSYLIHANDLAIDAVAGNGNKTTAMLLNKEKRQQYRSSYQERLSKASLEKEYGYYVKVRCYWEGALLPDGRRKMNFVVSRTGDVEMAEKWKYEGH